MIIRTATVGDENGIYQIAKELELQNFSHKKSSVGFIVYKKTPRVFLKRILLCRNFFVLQAGKQIIGYILAYTRDEMKKLEKDIPYLDSLLQLARGQDFLLIDHVAVTKKCAGQGLGSKLLRFCLRQNKGKTFLGLILHSPTRNQRSIKFFKHRHGWYLLKRINLDNMLCGVYASKKI